MSWPTFISQILTTTDVFIMSEIVDYPANAGFNSGLIVIENLWLTSGKQEQHLSLLVPAQSLINTWQKPDISVSHARDANWLLIGAHWIVCFFSGKELLLHVMSCSVFVNAGRC